MELELAAVTLPLAERRLQGGDLVQARLRRLLVARDLALAARPGLHRHRLGGEAAFGQGLLRTGQGRDGEGVLLLAVKP